MKITIDIGRLFASIIQAILYGMIILLIGIAVKFSVDKLEDAIGADWVLGGFVIIFFSLLTWLIYEIMGD